MDSIPFYKMSGSGNDFILIDNRQGVVPPENRTEFVTRVCRRKMSAGADGLILIENSRRVDFKWQFYNADGSIAEMCGNGARCAARFASLNGIAEDRMAFETVAGIIQAAVSDDQVKIKMTDPFDMKMGLTVSLASGTLACDGVNTGVPHVVIAVDDIQAADVVGMGREIRNHPDFAPAGTNVNFVAARNDTLWSFRTYERGVEDETLACGTGAVAVALVLAKSRLLTSPVVLKTRSGSCLRVYFSNTPHGYEDIFLEGDARVVYQGNFWSEAWDY